MLRCNYLFYKYGQSRHDHPRDETQAQKSETYNLSLAISHNNNSLNSHIATTGIPKRL